MPLSYFKAGGEYTGQISGMRYLIKKEDDKFAVYTWKGPFRFDVISDENKVCEYFDLNENGRENITKSLRNNYESKKDYWDKTVLMNEYDKLLHD